MTCHSCTGYVASLFGIPQCAAARRDGPRALVVERFDMVMSRLTEVRMVMEISTVQPARLKRRLGLPLLVLYGTGITIGAGIYVLLGAVAAQC
jgi:hypothetical protein